MERTQEPEHQNPQNPMQPVMELLQGGDAEAICSKYGISRAELDQRLQQYQASLRQIALSDHLTLPKVGRNDPCPCGSGKKYKKCCLPKHEEARKGLPPDQLQEVEQQTKRREKLEKEVQKGFDLLFSQDYRRAGQLAEHLLESFPEDDRLHDIAVASAMDRGDYDGAFHTCRRRWQIAQEEKAFYQENGYHKREGTSRKQMVHFYSPSTWLERFWIAQRARTYDKLFPRSEAPQLTAAVEKLKIANDSKRFPGRQEEGYEARRQALAPQLSELEAAGASAIPYLLPLTYTFSWASLFVPDLLSTYSTDESLRLLGELSMFRFPFFSQKCLANLEGFGERAVEQIEAILQENPAFDELKVGLLGVLGNLKTSKSFTLLTALTEHENPYVVNWAAQALEHHHNPEALPYLEKAKERLVALSKVAGAIRDIAVTREQ